MSPQYLSLCCESKTHSAVPHSLRRPGDSTIGRRPASSAVGSDDSVLRIIEANGNDIASLNVGLRSEWDFAPMFAAIGRVEQRTAIAPGPNVAPHGCHRTKGGGLIVEHASPLVCNHRALKVAVGADAPLRSYCTRRVHSHP